MARRQPLILIFQWHMHQPLYKDAVSGRYLLPWVRLHCTKDYTDMAWHLERYPEVKGVINFVPSLLKQIREYTDFASVDERFLHLTQKPAADLSAEDQQFVLRHFFQGNQKGMVDVSRRYSRLLDMRGTDPSEEELEAARSQYTHQDFLDLQMWFLLAWTGEELQEEPEVVQLIAKDRNFTEQEKQRLLNLHQQAIRDLLGRYRKLQESEQIEITGSPYTHPILPLLLDSEVARISMPDAELPFHRFSYPKEAEKQITRALQTFRDELGWEIQGMWPSEGAVSEAAVSLMRKYGIRYITTDSNILARTFSRSAEPARLAPEQKYKPYSFPTQNGELAIFARDQQLSDCIGFQYGGMEPAEAVEDFVSRLYRIDDSLPDDNYPYVVVITMDGENAWEYYPRNGRLFFEKLYGRLAEDHRIRTTTFSEHLERTKELGDLDWIYPGSWIQSDFHYWIGDPVKNAAWDRLHRTLQQAQRHQDDGGTLSEQAEQALLQAEGSDWFWWYGNPNHSVYDYIFDQLFCDALRRVHTEIEAELPEMFQDNVPGSPQSR